MATCELKTEFVEMIREPYTATLSFFAYEQNSLFFWALCWDNYSPAHTESLFLTMVLWEPFYHQNIDYSNLHTWLLSIVLGLCHRKQKSAFESHISLSPKKEQHILLTGCVIVSLCVHKYHTANNYNNNSTKENENPQNIILFLITRMNQYNKLNYNWTKSLLGVH